MKLKSIVISFSLITLLYLFILIWVDSENQLFSGLPKIISLLPILFCLSLLSYLVRYFRWYWLLCRAGNKTNLFSGFLAYLVGALHLRLRQENLVSQ